MKTILKILAALIVLIVAALIVIPVIFKDDIVQLIKDETNNAVEAKVDFGDFDLSLIKSFPNFFFSIEEVKVSGIKEFDGIELATVKELDLVVDVMSVINGESIAIKRISIIEPTVHAKVLDDGKANYLITKEDSTAEETIEEEEVVEESSSFKMELKELKIVNAKIIYDDATMPVHVGIDNLNLDISGDFTENITNLDAKGDIDRFNLTYDGVHYMNNVKILLDLILGMNLEEFKFTFKENEVRLNELPLGFDGYVAMPSDAIDMDLTFLAKETAFRELLSMIPAEFTKDLEGVKTDGILSLNGYAKGTYLDSIYPAFGLNLAVENAMFQYPDLPKSVDDIQIKASVESKDGDLDNTIVDVQKFHIKLAENPFDFYLYMSNPMTDPFIKAGMNGKLILDNIRDVIPLEEGDELAGTFTTDLSLEGRLSTLEKEQYEDFKAKGSLLVEGIHYATDSLDYPVDLKEAKMEFTPQYVKLEKMDMLLGKSDISASGQLENFIGFALKDNQVLKGNLTVKSKLMDINELAGIDPEAEEELDETEAGEGEEATESEEPMEVVLIPKNIEFITRAEISKLVYDNMTITDIKGGIDLVEEKIAMTNTSMNLLGGNMIMNGYYETSDSTKPTYDFGMNIKKFDIEQTMETFNSVETLAPIAKQSTGAYSTTLKVNGALDKQMEPIYESMNGSGTLNTHGVAIQDYKPLKKIGDIIKNDKINPLSLNDVAITYKIADGKVYVDPFTNKIGNTKLTIAGSNSFDQTIDYVFSFEIPREEFGSAANDAVDGLLAQAANKGVNIDLAKTINLDVRLTGDATNPDIKTDFKKSKSDASKQLKEKAKEELDKKKKELEQKAKEELDKQKKELEKKAKEELEKKKKEAEKELKKKAKDKLKGLFGG